MCREKDRAQPSLGQVSPIPSSESKPPPIPSPCFGPNTLLALFSAMQIFTYFDRGIMAGLLPIVQKEMGLSKTMEGFLGGGFIVGFMVMSPLVALYAARNPHRVPVAIGSGLMFWILAAVVAGLAGIDNYIVLLVARIVSGSGEAAFCSLGPTIIKDQAPPGRQATYLSIYFTCIFVGQASGYIASGFATVWSFGQWLFLIEAMVMLPLAGVCLFRGKWICSECSHEKEQAHGLLSVTDQKPVESPLMTCENVSPSTFARSAIDNTCIVVKNRIWLLLTLGYACSVFTVGGLAFWGPEYLVNNLNLDSDLSGLFFGFVTMLSGVTGTVAGGAWLDAISSGKSRTGRCAACAWMACNSGILAVPLNLYMAKCKDVKVFFASAFFAQFVLFMSTTPVNTGVMEAVPDHMRGTALALTTFSIHFFGDLPSSVIVGEVADMYSLHAGVFLLASWTVFTAIFWFLSYRVAASECARVENSLLAHDVCQKSESSELGLSADGRAV